MNNPTTLSWTGSNEREDGTPYLATDRRGYNVFIYPAGQAPAEITFIAVSEVYEFSMPVADLGAPLAEGDYEMVITDVDTDGRESTFSVPLLFSIVVASPKPPTGLVAL